LEKLPVNFYICRFASKSYGGKWSNRQQLTPPEAFQVAQKKFWSGLLTITQLAVNGTARNGLQTIPLDLGLERFQAVDFVEKPQKDGISGQRGKRTREKPEWKGIFIFGLEAVVERG